MLELPCSAFIGGLLTQAMEIKVRLPWWHERGAYEREEVCKR